MSGLKKTYFGRSDVEVKSNWLRLPHERRHRYCRRYGISEGMLGQFTQKLIDWMSGIPAAFVAVAIDKIQMQEKYGPNCWYASATAYQFLLQRFEKHLRAFEAAGGGPCFGHVTLDNMDGSSPKQNQWRDLIKGQHDRLKKDGCGITKIRFEHIADRPRFADSSAFHLLQLADLLAYNVFRQFRNHGEVWDNPNGRTLPIYPKLEPLLSRFMRSPTGQWEGRGMVK